MNTYYPLFNKKCRNCGYKYEDHQYVKLGCPTGKGKFGNARFSKVSFFEKGRFYKRKKGSEKK